MNTQVPQELGAAPVLDSMSDGFVALDRDWRFTYVNTRGAEIQGRPAESLIGRNLFEVYPEAVGTPFEQAYRKAMIDQGSDARRSLLAALGPVVRSARLPDDRWNRGLFCRCH